MEKKLDLELTPAELAEAFWHMPDDKQAEFFKCLSEHGSRHERSVQWLSMTNCIKKDKKASECFLDFSVFAFDYWPQKLEL